MNTTHYCTAEIGKPGAFHPCLRPAHWRVMSAVGHLAHYCSEHKAKREAEFAALDYTHMKPAPFAEWTPIT